MSYDIDVFQRAEGESSASVIVTAGAATYSDFLGRGRRRFLNRYIGLRAGYAYLESSRVVIAADAGLELFKSSRFMLDANIRTAALIGDETDFGLVGALSGVVAF